MTDENPKPMPKSNTEYFTSEIPKFFEMSKNGKPWQVKWVDEHNFIVTKVGKRCDVCSEKFARDMFKSIRVQYAIFRPPGSQETKQEMSWLNTKCEHMTVIIYKNGIVKIKVADWFSKNPEKYSPAIRAFDDIKNLPSDIYIGME